MAGARVRVGAAALLACAAFAGMGSPASGQQDERAQPPTELLREYPFEQGRLRSRERNAARRSSARSAASTTAGDAGSVTWLALGAAALLGLLALIATRRAQRTSQARLSGRKTDALTEGTEWFVLRTEPKGPSPAPGRVATVATQDVSRQELEDQLERQTAELDRLVAENRALEQCLRTAALQLDAVNERLYFSRRSRWMRLFRRRARGYPSR
jgi:hypothetical protein